MILDCTVGYRKMWKGKCQNVLFLDKRKEVNPDIIASNEYMPFRNGIFEKIVYDPPHLVHALLINKSQENSMAKHMSDLYSIWKKKIDFIRNIVRVNNEANRTLEMDGILFCRHTPLKENISLEYFIRLLEDFKAVRIRKEKSRSQFKNKVYYITMKKK